MSGLWTELRPYLVLWPAVRRLAVGTWRLLGTVTSKCMAGEGSDKAWRLLGLLALGEFVRRLAERAPLLTAALTLAWLLCAWRHGKPTPKNEQQDDGQEQPDDAAVVPEEPPLPDREQLVTALHTVADPHAHLSAIAAHLALPPARVREGLTAAGIPIAGGVRAGGRVSTGVKAGDFPPLLPSPTDPPDGVVVAGQPDNNNTDGRRPYLSREGYWTVPDPERPHAWSVAKRT